MNNLKKLGLTALAGSLMATSAYAADYTIAGGASMDIKNRDQLSNGRTIGMGNQLNFSASGETDGGLTVSTAFELDQAAAGGAGPFDNHSVSVGSDSMGTITVAGHGGTNAGSALDATAAGDLWDNTLGGTVGMSSGASGNNLVTYALPALMDDVAVAVSYSSDAANAEGSTAIGVSFTGVEGLTVKLGRADDNSAQTTDATQTTMSASYAMGSFTVGYSNSDYDHTTSTSDQEVTSYGVSYTVSDSISISYGVEDFEKDGAAADAEVEGISASYTSGGMTVTAKQIEATDNDYTAGANNDTRYWNLGASFAF
jgi:outer membrane protein OmpU